MLLNRQFPRSVSYCIEEIITTVDRIESSTANPVQSDLRQALEELRTTWTTRPIEDLINAGLHQGIDHLQSQLNAVHDQLQQTYFTTSPCT